MMNHYKVIFDVQSGGTHDEDEETVSTNSLNIKGPQNKLIGESKITTE